jgi:hypothetical protein
MARDPESFPGYDEEVNIDGEPEDVLRLLMEPEPEEDQQEEA